MYFVFPRFMPMLTMFQEIHFKLMRMVRRRREKMAARHSQITPKARERLDLSVKWSRKWQATWDGDKKYMVLVFLYVTKS